MRASGVAIAVSMALVGLSFADSASAVGRRMTSIPQQDLSSALRELARERQFSVLARSEIVRDVRTAGAVGEFTTDEALRKLLSGTALTFQYLDEKTVTIVSLQLGSAAEAAAYNPAETVYLAQSDTAVQAQGVTGNDATSEPTAPKSKKSELEEIVVTGSHIRGGTTSSPIIVIDAMRIKEEGFTDLGEVVRSLPQNFSGGQNPEVPSGNLLGAGIANQNVTGGSGLNLRGLGPDATLTLLNGRRLSYSGLSQAIDISMIPVEAVDRIDIVPDGASAVYGSDAVGGVGNVILRRDFEGVTVGARYGTAADGGLTTREFTATAGTTWTTGGLLATFMKASNHPIYARERDYTRYLADPTTIYPKNDLRSGLLSVRQSLGDVVELHLDALKSDREQVSSFFLSSLPRNYRIMPETSATWVAPSIAFSLPSDWTLSVGATWGRDESVFKESSVDIPTEATSVLYDYCFCNDLRSYEVGAEGALFGLPGGDARLAVGAGYRTNKLRQVIEVGFGVNDLGGDESSRFGYAEFNLPLIGPESNVTGVRSLVMTAAARSEDYDSFGRVTTPQFGVVYGPTRDFTVKGAWGKSFKAPTLYQNYISVTALLYPAATLGGQGYPANATAMYVQGGNRALKPERAETWTAALMFHPEALPNLQAELTAFGIDYSDRVVFPFTNATQGLSNPIYAPWVEYSPTVESQSNVIENADGFINATGRAYDPGNVIAILHGRFANVTRQRINGTDLSGSYRFDLDTGHLTIRGSASWLDSSQQLGADQESTALAGTLFNPAKVNGRVGLVWNRGGFTASAFANYTGGVRNVVRNESGGSFTTIDTTARYATAQNGGWSGFEFALSARNLFNQEPPMYTPASRIYQGPYDPTNYSAVGRFVSLSVSKHW